MSICPGEKSLNLALSRSLVSKAQAAECRRAAEESTREGRVPVSALDIAVRKGYLPAEDAEACRIAAGESRLTGGEPASPPQPPAIDDLAARPAAAETPQGSGVTVLLIAMVVVLLVLVSLLLPGSGKARRPAAARTLYAAAVQYAQQYPDAIGEAAARFEQVALKHAGTKIAEEAGKRAQELRRRQAEAARAEEERTRREAERLAAEKRREEESKPEETKAVEEAKAKEPAGTVGRTVPESDTAAAAEAALRKAEEARRLEAARLAADETRRREQEERRLARERAAREREAAAKSAEYESFRKKTDALLKKGGEKEAAALADRFLGEPGHRPLADDVRRTRSDAETIARVRAAARSALAGMTGKSVRIKDSHGNWYIGRVRDVTADGVQVDAGTEDGGRRTVPIPWGDLSAETVASLAAKRLDTRSGPDSLALGVFHLYAGNPDAAYAYLERARLLGEDVSPYAERLRSRGKD